MANVLVCDDNPDILEMLAFVLEGEGHEVRTATNGREVLGMVAECRPDLVLLDIRMPGLDGLGVLRALSQAGENSPPVVVLSAKTREEDRRAALEAGAMSFLGKPFELQTLLDTVGRYLP